MINGWQRENDAMVSVDDESTNQTFLDFFEDAANIVGGE